jgi:K+-sensing histidine kinase KdpD
MLFTPFLELRNKIGVVKPQNDNVGLGLSCGKSICKKLGGDMKLLQSEKGLTVVGFKIPVGISLKGGD